jgi:RimJ/RimL family protein N-acetyltransferase
MPEEYLRKADYSDMELLFQWANDPETRANSFNSEPILFDDHKHWFSEKINSPNVVFFIYRYEGRDIGQVRLDISDDTAIINYSIDPFFRGKGYGYRMITLTEKEIQNDFPAIKWIQAEIKYENKASQNIFRKLNYVEYHAPDLIKFVKVLISRREYVSDLKNIEKE